MKSAIIGASLAFAASVVAAPGPPWASWSGGPPPCPTCPTPVCPAPPVSTCLTQDDANTVVANFIAIIDHPDVAAANVTAQAFLADSFFEKSDSINMLAGFPVGSTSFASKAIYIANVLNAPSITNITTIAAMPAGCNNVLWYWRMGIGKEVVPVQGFNLMEIVNGQLAGQFVEFNNIGWGIDTGLTVLSRNGTKLPLA